VSAQAPSQEDRGWEFGVRYWWSKGKTQWNQTAQGVDSSLGNPTSVLVYDRLYGHSLEFQGAKRWRQGWFVAGNIGGGNIYSGALNDSDYFAGQIKFSETTSSVADSDLAYLTADGGYNFLRPAGGSTLGVFGGFHYWNERVKAWGASFIVPAGVSDIPNNVRVITNDVEWYSIRAGLNARAQVTDKALITASFAAVPRTWMRNHDSHHLRSDLGPTPNVTMDGTGRGLQFDAEARYAVYKRAELGLGLRYWKLRATGELRQANFTLPLNEFESTRYGATLSFTSRW